MIPGKHINVVLLVVLTVAVVCCSCSENNGTYVTNSNATRQARVNHQLQQQQQINNQGFCTGTNGVAGVCMTRMACTRGGGTQLGFGGCGTYNICCDVPTPCNSNTPLKNKNILLKNPASPTTQCTYTIQPYNANVCQLRFDFVDVQLAAPTAAGAGGVVGGCEAQFLDINGKILCGDLSGQHLYVPIDQSTGILGSEFSLQFYTAGVNSATTSRWNIQVTQLECPQTTTPNKNGLFTIPRQSTLQDLRRMFAPKSNDAELLAPAGCDQYYTAPKGTVRSFNYQAGGTGQYPQNLHYTICFKRGPGDSTLEIGAAANKFQMSGDPTIPAGESYLDAYCHPTFTTPGFPNDYLMTPPNSVYSVNTMYDAVFYCGDSLSNYKVMIEGPFILTFHSDGETDLNTVGENVPATVKPESGFELDYTIY